MSRKKNKKKNPDGLYSQKLFSKSYCIASGVSNTKLFFYGNVENLFKKKKKIKKNTARNASKSGTSLTGKNLLPEEANSYL